MKVHEFIFSNKLTCRILRHTLFWMVRLFVLLIWSVSIYYVSPLDSKDVSFILLVQSLIFDLIIDIGYCYIVVYSSLLSLVVKRQYLAFGFYLFLLSFFVFVIKCLLLFLPMNIYNQSLELMYILVWLQLINFFNMGPPMVCVFFLSIKMLKTWYLKEEEKIVLIRENVNAELQLLKAQIHPHFLFNTLNNIYSFTLVKSRMAGELILKLSDTLQYMINDCKASHVPLVKELKIIEDFIDLQKVRYGNRLQLQVAIEGNAENKFITPLLLIPFVENCFKHGTSKMLDYPWLKLEIEIMDKVLFFRLSNSKPSQVSVASTNSGIGLKNVQKRLALLYPLTHVIQFTSDDHSFTVHLEVPLNEELIADDVYLEKPNFYA